MHPPVVKVGLTIHNQNLCYKFYVFVYADIICLFGSLTHSRTHFVFDKTSRIIRISNMINQRNNRIGCCKSVLLAR